MSEEDGNKLSLASRQTDADMERTWALNDVEHSTREFIANLLRVIRGAGRPAILMSQMFELTKVLVGAFEKATPYEVSQRFELVLAEAVPDWVWGEDKGCEHSMIRGALQIIASNLLGQTAQQSAGESELYDGVNRLYRRREERRRKEAEEYRELLASIRPKRKARKPAKKKQTPIAIAAPAPLAPPEPDPDPATLTTAQIMRINRERLRQGKLPI